MRNYQISNKEGYDTKTSRIVAVILIILVLIIAIHCHVSDLEKKLSYAQEENQNLVLMLQDRDRQIEELSEQANILNNKVESLEAQGIEDSEQIKSLENKVKEYKKTTSATSGTVNAADSGFRSYMSYKAITNTASAQYKVVHQATPNQYGILEIDGRAVVAIGTGWGLPVGARATVTTDQGSFKIVVGDIKADSHTDSTNKVTVRNGCVVEFIIDPGKLSKSIKSSGNVATVSTYAGKVINITEG